MITIEKKFSMSRSKCKQANLHLTKGTLRISEKLKMHQNSGVQVNTQISVSLYSSDWYT